jgi:L-cystine transport system ATP-binding protein
VGEVLSVMRTVAQMGITMLVVTHEMSFASKVANKAIFMEGGRIVEEGLSRQIFSSPREKATRRFLESFLGSSEYAI